MAKARKIEAHRNAVKSIATVTGTMEMVATARFRRAYNRCLSARDYIDSINALLKDMAETTDARRLRHPLLWTKSTLKRRIVLVIASDRGLCGGYNGAVTKLAANHLQYLQDNGVDVELHAAGKQAVRELPAKMLSPKHIHPTLDGGGDWTAIAGLADEFMQAFLGRHIAGVDLIYAQMQGAGNYKPMVQELLPLMTLDEDIEPTAPDASEERWGPYDPLEPLKPPTIEWGYEFIPNGKTLLTRLLPMAVRLNLYQAFMEAAVTEQIARMSAMRTATQSAKDMIDDLTVQYNRTRQSQITTELSEILGGRIALE